MLASDINILSMKKSAENSAAFLKLLANPTRLLILCNLVEHEKRVGELEKDVDISQSALSQHLSRMRSERIVKADKRGQHVYYSISDPNVVQILKVLYDLFCKK